MHITNKLNLPLGLVKAVSTERHNAPRCLSATTLLQGVKQIILTERHWEHLADDASDRVWAVFGSAVHSLLEQEGETEFTEQNMTYPVGGITVTGCIDNYDMERGIICDYKTAPVIKIKLQDFKDWHRQGMIYAWLLVRNGFRAAKCRFIALLKDHSKSEASRDSSYPQNPVYVYEFDITPPKLAAVELFIMDKVREYSQYIDLTDDAIPPCSPAERWDKATKYAVKKQGRKTAVRVLDAQEAADQMTRELGTGHFVEIRAGESVRCQGYCLCREFCSYYRETVKPVPVANIA